MSAGWFIAGLLVGVAVGQNAAKADGIAAYLLQPDVPPCATPIQTEAQFNAQVIGDPSGLYPMYLGLRLLNCGDAPANLYDVAWYTPGGPRFYWDQPPPLPPSPVPLPPTGVLLAWALTMSFGIGFDSERRNPA